MSGAVKGVRKIFRKVVKSAKILVPVVLAAAAIYFTVGASSGVQGTAGGWLSSNLGLSGGVANVVSGAVTQAGYGAILGGGIAAATGGDVGQGLLGGAAAGAITGGLTGALAPVSAASSGATGTTGPGSTATGGLPSRLGLAESFEAPSLTNLPLRNAGGDGGLLSGVGDFITNNQELVGGALQGLGAGIGNFAQAEATVDAAKILAEQEEVERRRIAGNFDVSGGGGLLSGVTLDSTLRPTPAQQFTPTSVLARQRGAMWRYNPATGQLELTPTAA